MKQHPDQLFREKLENLELTAPANAWSRIETGLDKKSRKGFWLKIAAGLALLSVASFLIWNTTAVNERNFIAQKTVIDGSDVKPNEPIPSAMDTEASRNDVALQNEKVKHPRVKFRIDKNSSATDNTVASIAPVEIQDANPTELVSQTTDVLVTEVKPESFTQPVESSAVYLVYTAEDVNEKYLRKQPIDEATSDEKKPSRIQMLMAVAHNVTTGDSGIGDLRQIKDEIFALNFLDKKNENRKKINEL